MSRFPRLLRRSLRLVSLVSPELSFDVGSITTRVWRAGNLIWNQPTAFAFASESASIVAIGNRALQLEGKSPKGVMVQFPIANGVVRDLQQAEAYFRALATELLRTQTRRLPWLFPRVTVTVPSSSTAVERQQFQTVLKQAGLGTARLLTKAQALSVSTSFHQAPTVAAKPSSFQPTCTIDIGGETVEIGVSVGREVVFAKTIENTGGRRFTSAIRRGLESNHQCRVSWQTAEKLKMQLAGVVSSHFQPPEHKMTIRGQHLFDHSLTTMRVTSEMLTEHCALLARELIDEVKLSLAQGPSEVVTESLERGVIVAGGGSLLAGLKEALAEHLGCEVVAHPQPLTALGEGMQWYLSPNK